MKEFTIEDLERIARVELGMRSDEFYSCTWYDWSLWMEKIMEDRRKRLQDHELVMDLFRRSLAIYYNWHRGNNAELSPQDFWSLSYDQPVNTDTEPSPEEKLKLEETIRRLESKSKRKRG